MTAQNTTGVTAVMPVSTDVVTAQIEAVATDIADSCHEDRHAASTPPSSKRWRPRSKRWSFRCWSSIRSCWPRAATVCSTRTGVRALCAELLPRALVVTPNIPEAEILSGRKIGSLKHVRAPRRRFTSIGGAAVVIKGGHARDASDHTLVDLLYDGECFTEYRTVRIDTRNTHGTGCTFASAIAARLAQGDSLPDAVARAQSYVAGCYRPRACHRPRPRSARSFLEDPVVALTTANRRSARCSSASS